MALIMGWFPCAAAVLGSPNAQGKPAQPIHLPLGGPETESRSPALQADPLLSEPLGKPLSLEVLNKEMLEPFWSFLWRHSIEVGKETLPSTPPSLSI